MSRENVEMVRRFFPRLPLGVATGWQQNTHKHPQVPTLPNRRKPRASGEIPNNRNQPSSGWAPALRERT